MPIELPDLDNRTWSQLRDWLTEQIPRYNQHWTNFNLSDPGITLLEMLCWVAETLLYRLDRIPKVTYLNILRLVAGATESEIAKLLKALTSQGQGNIQTLDQDYVDFLTYLGEVEAGYEQTAMQLQRAVLDFLDAPYLAVTGLDIANLVLETNRIIKPASGQETAPKISQAVVKADHDGITVNIAGNMPVELITPASAEQALKKLGGTRAILVAEKPSYNPALVYGRLLKASRSYLTPRWLVGVASQTQPAQFTPINVRLRVTCSRGVQIPAVVLALTAEVVRFLNPLTKEPSAPGEAVQALAPAPQAGVPGEQRETGWPYNQAPTETDLTNLALDCPGVEQVTSVKIIFGPTIVLGVFSSLGFDTMLRKMPPDLTRMVFRGLPRLRVLDVAGSPPLKELAS